MKSLCGKRSPGLMPFSIGFFICKFKKHAIIPNVHSSIHMFVLLNRYEPSPQPPNRYEPKDYFPKIWEPHGLIFFSKIPPLRLVISITDSIAPSAHEFYSFPGLPIFFTNQFFFSCSPAKRLMYRSLLVRPLFILLFIAKKCHCSGKIFLS